jgi:hypothetical protein
MLSAAELPVAYCRAMGKDLKIAQDIDTVSYSMRGARFSINYFIQTMQMIPPYSLMPLHISVHRQLGCCKIYETALQPLQYLTCYTVYK